jgi:hypothetical protein
MEEQENYIDNFNERRDFFQRNFPMKIAHQRTDVNSADILKNSCPVCGYLTLDERASHDICGICFWQDDGIDDFEENEGSGPNHMTVKEGRFVFKVAKEKLMNTNYSSENYLCSLKEKFSKLDNIIEKNIIDKKEIIRIQDEILDLLKKNNIYGLEEVFNK